MSSVSQVIPNYFAGGISDQPDELKRPGQLRDCVNAFPDAVKGLVKRPGLEKIQVLDSLCKGQSINSTGSYFHFSRENVTNQNKQDYIGNVNKRGQVTVFRCSDGETIPTYYSTKEIDPNDNEGFNIRDLEQCLDNDYLRHTTDDVLKFTTVNNYTFITNPEKAVTMSRANNERPYEAFIEITQLVYSREYLLDIDIIGTDDTSSYTKATEISLTGTANFGGDNKDASCPANFRGTVTLDAENGPGKGLVVEIDTVGVQTPYNDGQDYECSYRHTIDLKNGGTDFRVGDVCKYSNPINDQPDTNYYITITEIETISSSADYQITGVLTPSDGDEVASIGSILNQMKAEIASTVSEIRNSDIEIIGNGLYITCDEPFTVTTSEKDLMNVLSNTEGNSNNPYVIVNNVSRLPIECKDGIVALVANSFSDDDDYWVQFRANYGDLESTAGTGYWEEIAEPRGRTKLNSGTMPQAMVYSRIDNEDVFVIAPVAWKTRTCGDDSFNPSFNNFTINNLLFYRNRLCALSQENVIMTKAGDLFNWFPSSALAVAPDDPIDISAATDYSSVLQDGLVGNNTLLLFSQLQQFQLTTDSDVLSPSTAKILEISRYNYNSRTAPINIGTNVGFVSDRGGRAKVYELSNVYREGSVKLVEKSKIVSESFHKNVKSIATSPEDELLLFANDSKIVWLYKFLDGGDKLLQDAWVKWTFPYQVIYHFIIDSIYYALLNDNGEIYLTRIDLEKNPTAGPFTDLWDANDSGVAYSMDVEFPIFYVNKKEGTSIMADTTSSLVVHRLHYNFGDIGTYNFKIKRDGYDDYDVLYESRYMDEYLANAEPLVPEVERTIPVYTRNTALNVSLKSDYDFPLILHSMRWEGDYNQRYYKRV